MSFDLNKIKSKIVKDVPSLLISEQPIDYGAYFEELGDLLEHDSFVKIEIDEHNFVSLKGIPEDFKIYLNDQLACEFCYGHSVSNNFSLCDHIIIHLNNISK